MGSECAFLWSPLGGGTDDTTTTLSVDPTTLLLYAGGDFTHVENNTVASHVAWWNGAEWKPLGNGVSNQDAGEPKVHSVNANYGYVLVGGEFAFQADSGKEIRNIVEFYTRNNNVSRALVPFDVVETASFYGTTGPVFSSIYDTTRPPSTTSYNETQLFAGGAFDAVSPQFPDFTTPMPANNMARFQRAGAWTTHRGRIGTDGDVYVMVVNPAGGLFVGGAFNLAGGVAPNHVAFWNGETNNWQPIGGGVDGPVFALAYDEANNLLYVGGQFVNAGTGANELANVNNVVAWDGQSWHALGDGVNGSVEALALDSRGNLYAAGTFTSPGKNVARWDGKTWTPLGGGVDGSVYALAVDATDTLYVGGKFDTVNDGAIQARNVATVRPTDLDCVHPSPNNGPGNDNGGETTDTPDPDETPTGTGTSDPDETPTGTEPDNDPDTDASDPTTNPLFIPLLVVGGVLALVVLAFVVWHLVQKVRKSAPSAAQSASQMVSATEDELRYGAPPRPPATGAAEQPYATAPFHPHPQQRQPAYVAADVLFHEDPRTQYDVARQPPARTHYDPVSASFGLPPPRQYEQAADPLGSSSMIYHRR